MKTSLTKGLSPTDKAIMEQQFVEGKVLRKRLAFLAVEKIESNRSTAVSVERYKEPSWAFFQADANGYERAMKEILSLLED